MARKKQTPQQIAARARKRAKATQNKKKTKIGAVALRQIRMYQKGDTAGSTSNDLLIPQAPVMRLLREISRQFTTLDKKFNDWRFTKTAITILHVVMEDELIKLFNYIQLAAIHAKRITIAPKDMQFVQSIREAIQNADSQVFRNGFPLQVNAFAKKDGRLPRSSFQKEKEKQNNTFRPSPPSSPARGRGKGAHAGKRRTPSPGY